MHVPQLPSLLPPLLCILALLPDTYSTATVPTADWNDPTLDYCAANILVVNSTSPPCKTQQTLARLPETNSYTIGDTSIVYMKFLTYDVIDRTLNYTSTGVFYPLVDDYSELTIPNSFSTLTTNTTDTTHGPLIGMELLYANTTQATDYLKWAVKEDGEYLSVTSRTAVVTLDNGILSSFAWFPTSCTLSTCTCLDNICTSTCTLAGNCTISVFVAWAGTDAQGNELTSSSRDIWRFQNAL